MRYTALALLAPCVLAQGTPNTTALASLAQALTGAGLTSLASVAASIANTSFGNQLLTTLTTSTNNFTVFAPSNAALGKVPKNVTGESLAEIIGYHVVSGSFLNTSFFFDSPNNTILSTALNATDSVSLQGNASQVIAATVKNNKITVLNQGATPVTVSNSTQINNFDILFIDSVLTPPGSIANVLSSNKLTLLTQALQQAGLTDAVTNAKGITVFAPTDAAFNKALAGLGAQATNTTLIQIVLGNHIINGTAAYSTEFDKSFTSAAGEKFTFTATNNTLVVASGNNNTINATVTTRDLLAKNGVVHIIDAVLANPDSDPSAASSAFNSATSQASNPTSASGPVGSTPPTTPNTAVALGVSVPTVLAIVGSFFVGVLAL